MFAGEAGHLNEYVLIKWRCFCTILFHLMNFWKAVIEGTREPIATRRIFFYFSFLIFPPPPLFDSHLAAGPCGWRSPGSATWYAILFPILTRCTVSREWLSECIYLEQTSREWRTHCLSTTPLFSSCLISFDDFRIRPAAQANIFFFIGLGLFVVGADCVCVLVPLRRGVAAASRLGPTPPLSVCLCFFVCMLCTCPCLFFPCCVLSLCPPGAGPTGEFTPRATSEVHKGPSDNDAAPRPLRAFVCPLLCVRVRHGPGGGAVRCCCF
ncbi:hypothetical protein ECC02_013689 [Trypanosoma cruzi]|uniref:Uncharacterized protein n=1 Tax=Trypanosoma cruzi TaxID=5693 RepID=A0A7J6XIP4_TRYCR|nr:hypothetical protein ECC02_013689 [Trypanosoma cruzi]